MVFTLTINNFSERACRRHFCSIIILNTLKYDVQLKGADDLGNKVEFYASYSTENKALSKIENIDGNLNENAKTSTLTPYTAEYPKGGGEMNNEFKKEEEAFTIDLSKLK